MNLNFNTVISYFYVPYHDFLINKTKEIVINTINESVIISKYLF